MAIVRKITMVEWFAPTQPPKAPGAILIAYNGVVWAGVYAAGRVVRYPEDFPPIPLTDCEAWCALPAYTFQGV